MEFQFRKNTLSGEYAIKCSMGHEVVGRWLEEEVLNDKALISRLLTAVETMKAGQASELNFQGREISVCLLHDEVIVRENRLEEHDEEALIDSEFALYTSESTASCGLEDFEELLRSWLAFIG
jgi:uncharacterized protein YacL (UPF0231 family)